MASGRWTGRFCVVCTVHAARASCRRPLQAAGFSMGINNNNYYYYYDYYYDDDDDDDNLCKLVPER